MSFRQFFSCIWSTIPLVVPFNSLTDVVPGASVTIIVCQATEAATVALLERVMRENAVHADQQRREQLLRDSHTLGRVIAIKDGMFVHEHWEDGLAFQTLRTRQADLKLHKDELEREKTEFVKAKRAKMRSRLATTTASGAATASSSSSSSSTVVLDTDERDDGGFKRPADPLPLDEETAEQVRQA